MIFLKCLYLLFLIDGICLSIKAIMSKKSCRMVCRCFMDFLVVEIFQNNDIGGNHEYKKICC